VFEGALQPRLRDARRTSAPVSESHPEADLRKRPKGGDGRSARGPGGSANCPSSGQCECPGHATLLDHSLPDGGSRWVLPTRIKEAVITCQVEMGRILYGAGIQVCPGAPSARLELRVLCEELLRGTSIQPAEGEKAVPAFYPRSGFAQLPLWFR
jgi:hypothetical protein